MQVDTRHELSPLTTTQRAFLLADLNPNRVQMRDAPGGGRGKKLSYLAAWEVKATLTKVFGFGGYSIGIKEARIIKIENDLPKYKWINGQKTLLPDEFNWRVTAQVTTEVYIHQLGTIYEGVAISSQTGADPGDVGDFAIKTADSDAFKRAVMNLGTQFGLSLYNAKPTDTGPAIADVVRQVLSPAQNGRAMRLRTLAEAAQLRKIESLEGDHESGVVVDVDEISAALVADVNGDTDAEFDTGDEDPVQHAGQPAAPAPRRGRAAAPQPDTAPAEPVDTPPSPAALDQIGEAFKQ